MSLTVYTDRVKAEKECGELLFLGDAPEALSLRLFSTSEVYDLLATCSFKYRNETSFITYSGEVRGMYYLPNDVKSVLLAMQSNRGCVCCWDLSPYVMQFLLSLTHGTVLIDFPLFYEDKKCDIIYNGELYTRLSDLDITIRRELNHG